MAWYDDIANTTKGNAQGLVNALRNPQDAILSQFKQGGLYKNKDALAALLRGDTAPLIKNLTAKSPANPMEALDAAMMLGTIKGVGKNISGLGYDQAKISNQYPEMAEPILAIDKKTGKEYLAKQNSAEALAVEKVRKAAQKEIDKGNYNPYFNLEERYYADSSKYPLEGVTVTDAMPKKQATIDKYKTEFDTPEARQRLSEAYDRGSQDPLTKDWYATGQLENEFIKQYGDVEGRKLYKQSFADAMAATTGGADPTSNLLMANFGNYMKQAGKELPTNAYSMPYPIGGRFATGNLAMYDKVLNQGNPLTASNTPKRFDFSANFLGHRDKATIDEQMSGGFQPGLLVPPGNSYGIFENVIHELAKEKGVPPANFQDVTWAGLKGVSGKPMMQHINEAIERTSRVTGKAPEQVVLDSLVKRTSPLYSAAPIGLGLMTQKNQDNK